MVAARLEAELEAKARALETLADAGEGNDSGADRCNGYGRELERCGRLVAEAVRAGLLPSLSGQLMPLLRWVETGKSGPGPTTLVPSYANLFGEVMGGHLLRVRNDNETPVVADQWMHGGILPTLFSGIMPQAAGSRDWRAGCECAAEAVRALAVLMRARRRGRGRRPAAGSHQRTAGRHQRTAGGVEETDGRARRQHEGAAEPGGAVQPAAHA